MGNKHTPGPWGIEQTIHRNWIGQVRIDGKVGEIVAITDRIGLKEHIKERNDANAKLIAAAPEMLKALEGVLDSIEAYSAERKPKNEWDEYDYMMNPRWMAAKALVDRIKS